MDGNQLRIINNNGLDSNGVDGNDDNDQITSISSSLSVLNHHGNTSSNNNSTVAINANKNQSSVHGVTDINAANNILVENDPDTDDEQHARSQILRKRARTNSLSYSKNNYPSHFDGLISVLPPETLCLIFSYIHSKRDLLSIALTCKYWADLIISMIWFRPGINNRATFAKLEKIMRLSKEETIWDYRKFIKRLNLSLIPNLVTDDFLNLFVGCSNLERITLVNCSKLNSTSIANLLNGCSRLQSIDLTGVTHLEDEIYIQLANNCKRLQGLYAPGSFNISQNAVMSLINNCPLLKRVKLSDCNNINDDVIKALVKNCPSLVELDIHGCEQVTNDSLHTLFSELECLKEFKISKNQNITYECFESPNGSLLCLDKLRILDFTQCSNITDKAVIKFIQLAPKLRNVVLSKCSFITDASLRAISTLGKNLHYVHLGHCSNITDAGAKELIKSCYRLQYIDLACCNQLTNATIVELANLPKLRRIGLVKCSQITDEGILALAENSRNTEDTLERIHLSYCVNLTIYPIYKLLRSCQKLTHISLTGISQFLRPDITAFCREPPSEFNPHQKSIFCVFSGEGVNLLRNHLSHLIQTTEVQDREATEILQIINGVIGTSSSINVDNFATDQSRERLEHFVNNAMDFLSDYDDIPISIDTVETFARCIFGGIQQTQATRVQRFFQLMHTRPVRARARERQRQLQLHQEIERELMQQEAERLSTIPNERIRALFTSRRDLIPAFRGSTLEREILSSRIGIENNNGGRNRLNIEELRSDSLAGRQHANLPDLRRFLGHPSANDLNNIPNQNGEDRGRAGENADDEEMEDL